MEICKIRVSASEAAKMLNLSVRKIDMLVADGRLAKCKIDGSSGYLVEDLKSFCSEYRLGGRQDG